MLEKPPIPDERIITCMQTEYGIAITELDFLPLGADANTAVYRAVARDGSAYFLKLRKGTFDPLSALLPQYLRSLGIKAVIAPLAGKAGQPWARLDSFTLLLYPFIPGVDGYQRRLTGRQWVRFGRALSAIHAAPLPAEIAAQLPVEAFSPQWRESVRTFQRQAEQVDYKEQVAQKMAAFLRFKRAEIDHMVGRASDLAVVLAGKELEFGLCHSDIHPGNLHLGPKGALYIVDWDAPILAPKERDLMLVGGCATWSDPRDAHLFFEGYGEAPVDRSAVAYYRYERIIWDVAAYCEQLLASEAGGEDREQSYRYFTSTFLPGHEYELALAADSG